MSNEEKFWYSVLSVLFAIVFTLGIIAIVVPEKVTRYSLSQSESRGLSIEKHLDWSTNTYIYLDRSISVDSAIQMVKELNSSIK